MNKKVLTLCAGVLLVGGSTVFTVNALNAGNEGVQTTAYVAQAKTDAETTIAGYELVKASEDAANTAVWSLKKENKEWHLIYNGSYYLNADGISKTPASITLMGKKTDTPYAISFDGGKKAWEDADGNVVYLWNNEGKVMALKDAGEGMLTLGTSETVAKFVTDQNEGGTNNNTKVAYIGKVGTGENLSVGAWSGDGSKNGATIWVFKNKNLSVTYGTKENSQGEAWLITGQDGNLTLSYSATKENKADFVYENDTLKLETWNKGEQILTPVYLTDNGFSLEPKSGETDNLPAVFFEATIADKDTANAKIDPIAVIGDVTEGAFVIGQGTFEAQADTKYVASPIYSAEENAPGKEYGTIDYIKFNTNGTLTIVDRTTTANVPVFIYYKNGDNKVYLNANGWGDTKEAWILNEGVLTTLDGGSPITNVTYVPGGIQIGNEETKVIYELAQLSIPAVDFASCENPLFMKYSKFSRTDAIYGDYKNDYVMLGGISSGVKVAIIQGRGQQASLAQFDQAVYDETALWKVNEVETGGNNRCYYEFINRQTEEKLNVGGYDRFFAYKYNGGVQLLAVDDNDNIINPVLFQMGINVTTTSGAGTVIGFYRSPIEQFTAQWLVHRYGSSFQLNFTNYDSHADKEWIGNVFDGADLVPVLFKYGKLTEVAPANDQIWREEAGTFLLKDRNTGLYLVLDVTGDKYGNPRDFINGGYPFDVLSESNMLKVLLGTGVPGKEYYPYFRINYVEGKTTYDKNGDGINLDDVKDSTPIECIEVGQAPNSENWYDVVIFMTDDKAGNKGHKDLFVTVEDHCEFDARRAEVSFTNEDNIVHGKDGAPLSYRYVNIQFKAGKDMQFQNENGNWVNLDGKVLGMNRAGAPMPTEAGYFLFDKAEGQWAVSVNANDDREFTFTNRENPNAKFDVKVMHALGNDTYAVEYEISDEWHEWVAQWGGNRYYNWPFGFANGRNQALRDTLIIKQAEGNLKLTTGKGAYNTDSYANWTAEELQDRTFQLSIDAAAQLYVTENEAKGSHFLGLTADAEAVTNWRLVPMTEARQHDKDAVKYLTAGTDSVYTMSHPMYWTGSEYKTYSDTTAIVAYALQNIANNEYLTYDPTQNQTIESMICDPESKEYKTSKDLNAAYRFVLKEKAKGAQSIESGKYSIIGVTPWGLDWDKYVDLDASDDNKEITHTAYYELNLNNKLYGASTNNAIEVEYAYLQPTSNDIFTIATTASLEYAKKELNDKIRIYSAEDNDYALYEDGQFLNMSNASDIAPAMVIDTAYVERPGNNRYQYLLVVNPEFTDAEYDNHPDNKPIQQPEHMIKPDTMKGRFLVNQIDEAVAASKMHNNPYINDVEVDEKEVKLAFKWGYRTQDKLFLTDGQDGPVIEEIELGTADFNKAKFAFKYVNQAVDETFKVQTAFYDYDAAVKAGSSKAAGVMNNEGYLKSVNGVIVVTNGYTHGEEFLMAPEESAATANESIAAEGAISVTATDGAVIIKGAEGKNVVIATILGKVVANETINSDNETIAVPAGIAVVSVDGESFKVVVK